MDDGMLGRRSSRSFPAWTRWALWALWVAALVQVAVRVMPWRGGMPELLIAVGATLVAASAAWEWAFPQVVALNEPPFDVSSWLFTLVSAIVTAGFVAMIAGARGALARDRKTGADAPPG